MNAFLAVLIIASVASASRFERLLKTYQPTDLQNQLPVTDLLRRLVATDRVGSNYPTTSTSSIFDLYRPRSSVYDYDYNRFDTTTTRSGVGIYSLDEIVRHPLFQTYYRLPYFRQHFSNRLFQYYLTTSDFLKYWTYPQFQQFFQNPYLFYKYIYPVVYTSEYNYTPSSSSIYNVDDVNSYYPVDRVNTDVVDRYLNNGVYDQDVYSNDVYNKYNTIYGQRVNNRRQLPYSYVLDKIFKHYFVNKPITEVVTDVKVQGNRVVDEDVIGKYVDPITRDVQYTTDDVKIVDEKVVPVIGERKTIDDIFNRRPIDRSVIDQLIHRRPVDRTVVDELINRRPIERNVNVVDELLQHEVPINEKFGRFNSKDALLKRLYLNKLTNGVDKINFDETPVDSEILRHHFNKDLLTRIPLTKEIKDFDLELPTTKTV